MVTVNIITWGNDVIILHRNAFCGETPRDARTILTANPSGMLCTAMATVTKIPWDIPLDPAKDTPTPAPSPKEWRVIIPTTRITLAASAPLMSNILTSPYCSRNWIQNRNQAYNQSIIKQNLNVVAFYSIYYDSRCIRKKFIIFNCGEKI